MLIALAMSTAGCTTTPSSGPLPVCPQIVEYSAAVQDQAALELQQLPPDGAVRGRILPDASRMRDEVRACRKAVR